MITVKISEEAKYAFAAYRRQFTLDEQVDALLEEMAELAHALLNARKQGRADAKEMDWQEVGSAVVEELADVQICLTQVTNRLCAAFLLDSNKAVGSAMEKKIKRMRERIGV